VSVSLRKGETVSLKKAAGGAVLSRVRMGLGWDAFRKRSLFGKKEQSIDLDASCLLFDAGRNLLDQVWFQQLRSRDGSVTHTGDNLTGAGDGDDESIVVDLTVIAPSVHTLFFVVNSFTGQNFSQIENAFCRLVNESTAHEMARFDLTGSGTHTAQLMSKLVRSDDGWVMTAVGVPASGRTFSDLLPVLASHL
jgi:tellurium resistance protein TerZ